MFYLRKNLNCYIMSIWSNDIKCKYIFILPLKKISTLVLTHWGRGTHICVTYVTIIVSDNGLSPSRHQAIIWTNAGILPIGPLGTNFNETSIGIQTFSFTKMHLKMSSAKRLPFCLGLNVLNPLLFQLWFPQNPRTSVPPCSTQSGRCMAFPLISGLSSLFCRQVSELQGNVHHIAPVGTQKTWDSHWFRMNSLNPRS